ncbi:thioredoxin domain-containing protein [Hathewaya massiliensis]|uniref:thioredoxin domain-containing protein n=1 Tax=Hathewaya massiliensis TaxID=1964382 RepID=UPI001157341D|nr:thioredoxin domain-containing protein [Hathewaya massiliensis]
MLEFKERKPNKLINESSPYLLQHAYNPVNWYPWGEEAFEKAINEDKPIFLSIGYSACHWCHVMEEESFEDENIANILNKYFVSIKVDREERPDVDHVYMTACQALTGSGGWPLNLFLTPKKEPFYAGTYFQKEKRYNMPTFEEILYSIIHSWNEERSLVERSSKDIVKALLNSEEIQKGAGVNEETIEKAYGYLKRAHDKNYGGFARAPKFPLPQNLRFLLKYFRVKGEEDALYMVENTLENMYKGGIYDHIGFGFSRYSTDKKWLAPHFEKMLYDNGLLAYVYFEAFELTGKELYKKVGEEIIDYLVRDMRNSKGGFYSAEDADSEGEEGKYYTFTKEEVLEVLGKDLGETYCSLYDITEEGNFAEKNIPNLIQKELQLLNIYKDDLKQCREKLLSYRKNRFKLFKDKKVLTSWNSMVVSALAYGGRILNREEYINYAKETLRFIEENLVREDGRILASFKGDKNVNALLGYLDDYAYFIAALIEIYKSTGEEEFLNKAIKYTEHMEELFGASEVNAYYFYGRDGEKLILRPIETYDGATPCGNAIATNNMLQLYKATKDEKYIKHVEAFFNSLGNMIKDNPAAHFQSLSNYLELINL